MTITGLIDAYKHDLEVSSADISAYVGTSEAGYYRKMKDPSQWRLGELNRAYEYLGIPKNERIYEV